MEYSLKRLLLYTNKEDKEEFGLPENVLRVFYELFITSKVRFPYSNVSFTQVFNEVFYILSCIHADKASPEHVSQYLNGKIALQSEENIYHDPDERESMIDEEERIEFNGHQLFLVQRYIFSFVWMALSMYENPPEHVHYFLSGLEAMFKSEKNPYYDEFRVFYKSHPAKIEQPFIIHPRLDINVMLRSVEEWKEVTSDFDKIVVSDIICRFSETEDRRMLVETIKQVLAQDNENPISSPKVSMVSHRLKATDKFLDELLKQKEEEDKHAVELEQEIEKSKEERIKELEAQVKDLKREKNNAIEEKKEAERERDKYRKKWEELTNRLNRKYIPAELKSEEAKLIIDELIKKDLITPLGYNSVLQFYRWEGTGALFGYFIDKMNFQLELADSGGRLNWKIFRCAFSNYEEKEKRARDTVSFYKQHPKEKMPENAEKIDEAIVNAEKILQEKKNLPKPPKIKLG